MDVLHFRQVALLLVTGLAISCSNGKPEIDTIPERGFTLNGQFSGYPDSLWVFLDVQESTWRDSARILNGRFTMNGEAGTIAYPTRASLTTSSGETKTFWLENSDILVEGTKGNLAMASVRGSRTQEDADAYDKMMEPMNRRLDSLQRLIDEKSANLQLKDSLMNIKDQIISQSSSGSFAFVKNRPHSVISAMVLSRYADSWGSRIVTRLYRPLDDECKDSPYGKVVEAFLANHKELQIGDESPDFEQASFRNERIRLSDFKGKIVLLEFWASWCGPCRRENPELLKTYRTYQPRGFEIVAVSLDDNREQWIKAIENDGLPWPNVSELTGDWNSAAMLYGVTGIPDNFLIDRNGIILDRNLQGRRLRERLSAIFEE